MALHISPLCCGFFACRLSNNSLASNFSSMFFIRAFFKSPEHCRVLICAMKMVVFCFVPSNVLHLDGCHFWPLQYDCWSSLLLSYFVTVSFSIAFFFCVSLHKCTLYLAMQRMTTPVERRYVWEGKPLALQKLILCLITMESYRTPLKSESFVVFLRQFITKATAPKEAKVLTKESHIRKRLSLYL